MADRMSGQRSTCKSIVQSPGQIIDARSTVFLSGPMPGIGQCPATPCMHRSWRTAGLFSVRLSRHLPINRAIYVGGGGCLREGAPGSIARDPIHNRRPLINIDGVQCNCRTWYAFDPPATLTLFASYTRVVLYRCTAAESPCFGAAATVDVVAAAAGAAAAAHAAAAATGAAAPPPVTMLSCASLSQ